MQGSVSSLARRSAVLSLYALAAGVPASFAQTTVSPGWSTTAISSPAPFSAFCTLQNGDLVTFDGQFVDRWSGDGSMYLGSLGSLSSSTFAGFAIPSPDGSSVYIGETVLSGQGTLHRVDLSSATIAPVASIFFLYDAKFAPNGQLYASASTTGSGNELLAIDVGTGTVTTLGSVSGPSGPLAVAPNGDLYYATQSTMFPPPSASTDVVRWSAAQVALGGLDNSNATLIAGGFDGGSSMDFDPIGNRVYLAETNFSFNVNRIRQVQAGFSPIVVDSPQFVSQLQILAGPYGASLDAFQPASGINLRYSNGGFDIDRLAPKRPVLSVRGAGTMGAGALDFTITGGPPSGVFQVTACPTVVLGPELPIQLSTFLLHTPFDLAFTRRVEQGFALDAQGNGSFTLFNQGSLQGNWAFQFFVGDVFPNFSGASNAVTF